MNNLCNHPFQRSDLERQKTAKHDKLKTKKRIGWCPKLWCHNQFVMNYILNRKGTALGLGLKYLKSYVAQYFLFQGRTLLFLSMQAWGLKATCC